MISESICNGEDMTQNNIFSDIINIDCIEEVKTLNTLKKTIYRSEFISHGKQEFNFNADIKHVQKTCSIYKRKIT